MCHGWSRDGCASRFDLWAMCDATAGLTIPTWDPTGRIRVLSRSVCPPFVLLPFLYFFGVCIVKFFDDCDVLHLF